MPTQVSLSSGLVSPWLSPFLMLLSQSLFLSLSLSSFLQAPPLFGCMHLLLSLCLSPPALSVLSVSPCSYRCCISKCLCTPLSPISSPLSSPTPTPTLSLLGSPAHLPKPLLASCVPNLQFHSLPTHVNYPRSEFHSDRVVGVLFDWE